MAKNELTRQEQCMSSLDIAAVTGKPHKDVLKAIRTMEPAWEKECGRNFSLTSEKVKMPQGGVRLIPVFQLTKTESLYVATKFNDEARARLDFDFSFEAALQQTVAVKGGNVSRNTVKQMLKNWKKQGLIDQTERGRYKKLDTKVS